MPDSMNLNKSSPDKYQLIFPICPSMTKSTEARTFALNIFGAVVPGVAQEDNEDHWQGAKIHRIVGAMDYLPYTINFLVDEEWRNWQYLYDWLALINNNKDLFTEERPDYVSDSEIIIKNNFNVAILNVSLKNMFPIDLSEVTLDQRAGEMELECSCTFVYDYFEVTRV